MQSNISIIGRKEVEEQRARLRIITDEGRNRSNYQSPLFISRNRKHLAMRTTFHSPKPSQFNTTVRYGC